MQKGYIPKSDGVFLPWLQGPVERHRLLADRVSCNLFPQTMKPNGHWFAECGVIELALWSDIYLIAPATSKPISSMAHGICNNLLLAVYFSSKSPVFVLQLWI